MKVCEIFTSIQGESTYAGLPCAFVRLSGCNLRCSYCDTQYAYEEGVELSIDEIVSRIAETGVNLVEITGGEPLLQESALKNLIVRLLDSGYTVLIETNGSINIRGIERRSVIILDIKTPGSGMSHEMDFANLEYLKPSDEVKFVLCDRSDYEWAKKIISDYRLKGRCTVLFSPAYGIMKPEDLIKWILEDRLDVRLNLQIQKYIFGEHKERYETEKE